MVIVCEDHLEDTQSDSAAVKYSDKPCTILLLKIKQSVSYHLSTTTHQNILHM